MKIVIITSILLIFSIISFLLGYLTGLVVAIYKELQQENEKLMKDFWKDLLGNS